MSIKDEFAKFINAGQEGSDVVTKDIPEAWRPRSEIGTEGGFVVSTPRPDGTVPGAEEILREANLNPEEWAVISHRRSRWQRYDGEWLESFRVNVVPVISVGTKDYDQEALVEQLSSWVPQNTQSFKGD